ncbi:hypothetical protein Q7P36_006700 [Cladosporium allicinum]
MNAKDAEGLRNTPGLLKKIEVYKKDVLNRFEALTVLASVDKTDRNTSANTQFQMEVETAHLIKATEDLQVLVRHLQEMWLFGPLNTIGESQVQQQTDENAKVVGDLLRQLSSKQKQSLEGNGDAVDEDAM